MSNVCDILLSESNRPIAADSERVRWLRRITRAEPPGPLGGRRFRWRMRRGDLIAVTGEPAARRTEILRAIERARLAEGGTDAARRVDDIELPGASAPIDRLALPRGAAHRLLCEIGLDCGWQQAVPASALSTAERWQLRLAVALAEAAGHTGAPVVLADRWCHELGAVSARCLCRQVRRIVQRTGVLLVVETARAELLSALGPRIQIRLAGGTFRVTGPGALRLGCLDAGEDRPPVVRPRVCAVAG